MASYYVNKNAQSDSGDHEVHVTGCAWLPAIENRTYLGEHASCSPAVRAARKYYDDVNGCYHCSEPCHTT